MKRSAISFLRLFDHHAWCAFRDGERAPRDLRSRDCSPSRVAPHVLVPGLNAYVCLDLKADPSEADP